MVAGANMAEIWVKKKGRYWPGQSLGVWIGCC